MYNVYTVKDKQNTQEIKMFTKNIAAQNEANTRAKNDGGELFEVELILLFEQHTPA